MGPKRGLEGALAYRENPQKHDFFKIRFRKQKISFSENVTWAEAVRKKKTAELFILSRNTPIGRSTRARSQYAWHPGIIQVPVPVPSCRHSTLLGPYGLAARSDPPVFPLRSSWCLLHPPCALRFSWCLSRSPRASSCALGVSWVLQ
jgi:hypothetical protein